MNEGMKAGKGTVLGDINIAITDAIRTAREHRTKLEEVCEFLYGPTPSEDCEKAETPPPAGFLSDTLRDTGELNKILSQNSHILLRIKNGSKQSDQADPSSKSW